MTVPTQQQARECNCDLRTKLVGDGCAVCNPEYARDHDELDDRPTTEPNGSETK